MEYKKGDSIPYKGKIHKVYSNGKYLCFYAEGKNSPIYLHRYIAGIALGRELKSTEQVHHVDGNKLNNAKSNLVICESNKYHQMLHVRARALADTGDANQIKCGYCKEYGANYMRKNSYDGYHSACANENQRQRKERKANNELRNTEHRD